MTCNEYALKRWEHTAANPPAFAIDNYSRLWVAEMCTAMPALIQEVRKDKARIAELEKQVRLLKYNNRAMEAELRGEENP